jgi:hypothetical protein
MSNLRTIAILVIATLVVSAATLVQSCLLFRKVCNLETNPIQTEEPTQTVSPSETVEPTIAPTPTPTPKPTPTVDYGYFENLMGVRPNAYLYWEQKEDYYCPVAKGDLVLFHLFYVPADPGWTAKYIPANWKLIKGPVVDPSTNGVYFIISPLTTGELDIRFDLMVGPAIPNTLDFKFIVKP